MALQSRKICTYGLCITYLCPSGFLMMELAHLLGSRLKCTRFSRCSQPSYRPFLSLFLTNCIPSAALTHKCCKPVVFVPEGPQPDGRKEVTAMPRIYKVMLHAVLSQLAAAWKEAFGQ